MRKIGTCQLCFCQRQGGRRGGHRERPIHPPGPQGSEAFRLCDTDLPEPQAPEYKQ